MSSLPGDRGSKGLLWKAAKNPFAYTEGVDVYVVIAMQGSCHMETFHPLATVCYFMHKIICTVLTLLTR